MYRATEMGPVAWLCQLISTYKCLTRYPCDVLLCICGRIAETSKDVRPTLMVLRMMSLRDICLDVVAIHRRAWLLARCLEACRRGLARHKVLLIEITTKKEEDTKTKTKSQFPFPPSHLVDLLIFVFNNINGACSLP